VVRVRIGEARLRTIITPEGEFKEVYEVSFTVDKVEYFVEIPKEKFDPEYVRRVVEEEARKIAGIMGQEFEV